MKVKTTLAFDYEFAKLFKEYARNHGMTITGLIVVSLKEFIKNHK